MSDEEIRPEGYPDHDTDWRQQRNSCEMDVRDVLGGYDPSVQAATLSKLLSEMVEEQAEAQFAREWDNGS